MNLEQIGIGEGRDDSGLVMTQFTPNDISPEMLELLGHLKRAESWGQVRAVLSLYCCVEDGEVSL